MKKNKISSVVKYTVEKSIKNKWFVILNALLLVVSIVFINFNTVKNILKANNIQIDNEKIEIVLVDNEDLIINKLKENIQKSEFSEKLDLVISDVLDYDKDNFPDDKIIIEVKSSDENILNTKVISKEGIDTKYYNVIVDTVSQVKNEILSSKYNISESELNKILEEPNIERIMTNVENEDADLKYILQTISNYAILLILMIVLSKIANDVSQEKISKSIEYVLTSITEKEYLISKVISINLTLIIQFIFGIVYFLIASSINSILNLYVNKADINFSSSLNIMDMASVVDLNVIGFVIVIFIFIILTVFIQCIIQAALSSKTTNITEANNATILLVTINLIIYMIATFAINPLKETNIIINILSFVPIVSMYFIPALMLVSNISVLHIVISLLVTIVSIPPILKYCSKIFKNGVLDYTDKKVMKRENDDDLKQREINIIKKKEYSKYGYVIGMSVIFFVVLQVLISIICSPLLSAISSKIPMSSMELNTILNIIVFIISLYVPYIFVKMNTDKENKILEEKEDKKIDLKHLVKSVFISFPIVVLIQIVLGILFEKLGLNYDIIEKTNIYDGSSVLSKILFFVQIAVLPAIFEELYVRGAVLGFSRKYGDKFAIISSAILFSLIHMNISQSIFAFLMGIILAILVIKTKSLIPAMLVHFINNGYQAIYLIFEDNILVLSLLNMCIILCSIVGIVFIIIEIIKRKDMLVNLFKKIRISTNSHIDDNTERKQTLKNTFVLSIFTDYSFIISFILILIMTILTQKMLMIL